LQSSDVGKDQSAIKSKQREINANPNEKASESVEKLRQVYSRTVEIMKDLSKSEAEHEVVKILNQGISRALGTPTKRKQQHSIAGSLVLTENEDGTLSTADISKGSYITRTTSALTKKKSSMQSSSGKKLNVSFNLSEDIRYFIEETFSEASSRNGFSSSSDGSNEDDVESSSVVSEDHTFDNYSSISTFGTDHDACAKVNEILSELRHIAEAFNIFNEDGNSVGADDFSASTTDGTIENDQEQLRAAMSAALSYRRKGNVTVPTSSSTQQ